MVNCGKHSMYNLRKSLTDKLASVEYSLILRFLTLKCTRVLLYSPPKGHFNLHGETTADRKLSHVRSNVGSVWTEKQQRTQRSLSSGSFSEVPLMRQLSKTNTRSRINSETYWEDENHFYENLTATMNQKTDTVGL